MAWIAVKGFVDYPNRRGMKVFAALHRLLAMRPSPQRDGAKRKIEVFSAECPASEETIQTVYRMLIPETGSFGRIYQPSIKPAQASRPIHDSKR